MSSSHPYSQKRPHDEPHVRDRDDEPWWERDRRGETNVNPSLASSGYAHRDRTDYANNTRGSYSGRGRGSGRGAYSGDRRPRDDRYDHRRPPQAGPPRGYPPPQGYNRHAPPPPAGRAYEDGEILLNYSDAPRSRRSPGPRNLSPRHASPPRSSLATNHDVRSSAPSAGSSAAVASRSHPGSASEDAVPINLEPVEEPDPEQVLAERRRKRAEILAKYATKPDNPSDAVPASSLPVAAATTEDQGRAEATETPGRNEVEPTAKRLKLGTASPAVSTPGTAELSRAASSDPTTSDFTLFKEDGREGRARDGDDPSGARQGGAVHKSDITGEDEPEVSAADYNPDFDRREDEKRMEQLAATNEANAGGGTRNGVDMVVDDEEETEEESDENDEEDEDDMFAIGTEDAKPKKKKRTKAKQNGTVPVVNRTNDAAVLANPSLLADNYDDAEGYYKVILGEVLDGGRYLVQSNLGKGMFSSVVKAKDLGEGGTGVYSEEDGDRREVAIKMVRSQESMFKAGMKEAQILRRLMDADPDDKKHLIRLLRTFEHRGHLCLVFESLSMNLREVVKRYGKDVGLNLRAVRAYASQMFLALALMKKCELMHADLKPDNILVNESKSNLKVCDLGSASDITENEITPYLVSRFYRAPEIILGLPYDCSLDVWSIGCTLYELYTGKILFPGRTNNHMLLLMMETKGKFQNKLVKKARFGDQHFDENQNFLSHEKNDTVTPRQIPSKPPADLRTRLMPSGTTRKMKEDEVRLLTHFVDLLDKMLSLEPAKRPLPKDLLAHPFIRG